MVELQPGDLVSIIDDRAAPGQPVELRIERGDQLLACRHLNVGSRRFAARGFRALCEHLARSQELAADQVWCQKGSRFCVIVNP